MAQVGGIYVSSVTYSVQPAQGTNDADLTNPTSNGVSFPSVSTPTALFDQPNNPLYTITFTFNPTGANSVGSITINPRSNVNLFNVQFFILSNPNQPFTTSSQLSNIPLSYNSTIVNSQASLVDFPGDLLSPLSGIRISILSTKDNQ